MKVTLFDSRKTRCTSCATSSPRRAIREQRQSASDCILRAYRSGKTIVMTALFEAILDEPDDQLEWPLNWQPQPDAVILWVFRHA